MISRVLRRFLRSRAPRSSFAVLSSILPQNEFESILRNTQDKREVFRAAAVELRLDEASLMRKIASRLQLPFLEPIVRCPVVAGSGCGIGELLRVGALTVTAPNGNAAVVCVDPASCDRLPQSVKALPCFIGTWSRIVEAAQAETDEDRVARRILELVITECSAFGASAVELCLSDETPIYRFCARDGEIGSGSIDSRAVSRIKEFSDRCVALGIRSSMEVKEGAVTARFERGESGRMLVAWSERTDIHPVRGAAPAASNTAPMTEISPTSGGAGRVLVIDDSGTFARVLERYLNRFDIAVVVRSDGVAALKEIERISPDLVICDVHMPALHGREIVRRLRMDRRFKDLPTIMLTSDGETETEIELLSIGADAFVTKDEDPRVLCAHVCRLLARSRDQRMAA